MSITLGEIAAAVEGELRGDPTFPVERATSLELAGPRDLALVPDARAAKAITASRAGAVVVPRDVAVTDRPSIAVDHPRLALQRILQLFVPPAEAAGIDPTAVIAEDVAVGDGTSIGAFSYIGKGSVLGRNVRIHPQVFVGARVRIGDNSVLYPQAVVLDDVVIGARVILHSHATVGSDGFGYVEAGGVHLKIPQLGSVILGDDVEVGAGAAIDRATLPGMATMVGDGTKIDNLVQVAHNCRIGRACILCGQTGLSGSVTLGDGVILGGQAGIADHVELGSGVMIGAQSGVTKSVPEPGIYLGYPAEPQKGYWRVQAAVRRVPELMKELKRLAREIEELKSRLR